MSRAASGLAIALALFTSLANAQGHHKNDDLARARTLDKEGAKAYGEGRYNDAIRYFEEAFRLGGPAFELWNVAKCHLRLDQPEQAADMLERYLATPNVPKDDRDEASQQLDALKKRPSTLTVSSTPGGATVTVDGKGTEGRTPLSTTLQPGTHTVTVATSSTSPFSKQVEARYGRAVIVDAALAEKERRPAPPDNPYQAVSEAKVALRAGLDIVLSRHGSVGGNTAAGLIALGTYRVADIRGLAIGLGGLVTVSADSWNNRTGVANRTDACGPIDNAQSATPLSFFALGTATYAVHPKVRVSGLGGLGIAAYFSGSHLGGDLFVPTCHASPGVRPSFVFGGEVDYLVSPLVRLSAFPLTWQIQPGFEGTRTLPRDAGGIWMRFGFGVGVGVDL